jgi:spermidine/putrescine transport system substrate-binding protein
MKRILIGTLALLGFTAGPAFAQETTWTCPAGFEGQQLNVYNWSTYVAENTISNFESLCDVKVVYDTYPTDDDMLARLRQGNPGYDIVVPTGVTMYLLVAEGLLERVDLERIPNIANIDPAFLNLGFDPDNAFSVPYQWGTVGIGYDTTRVDGEVTSWNDLFTHDGPVSWLEDYRAMLGTALIMLGSDPNTSDPAEIAQARNWLIERGGNVVYIAADDGQELLARGEVDMTIEYSGDIFQIMEECECDTYAYVIPEEGAEYWVDVVAIPAGARNPELAHVFMDYLLDPAVGADISNYTAFGTPNRASINQGLIDAELLDDPAIYPSDETFTKLFMSVEDEALEQIYNDAWDEIKIFIGN